MVSMIPVETCWGECGRAFYAKGRWPFDEFLAAVREVTDPDDRLLTYEPEYLLVRITRDFQEKRQVVTPTDKPGRGAFWVTWVDDLG